MIKEISPQQPTQQAEAPHFQRDRLLRVAAVENIVGLKKSTIYKLVQQGIFPAPVRIGARASGWSESAVLRWVQERIQHGGVQ